MEYRTAVGSAPAELVLAPDGNSVWFTEPGTGTLADVTDKGRYQRQYVGRGDVDPESLTVGRDGGVWFTEANADRIGRLGGGHITSYRLAPGSDPRGIAAGADGAVWFTEAAGDRIGRISVTGRLRTFAIPAARADPVRIAAGPDGALWFTEPGRGEIGRITTTGRISEFRVPGAGRLGHPIPGSPTTCAIAHPARRPGRRGSRRRPIRPGASRRQPLGATRSRPGSLIGIPSRSLRRCGHRL